MTTAYEKLLETEEGRIALAEEHAIAHVGDLLSGLLEKSGMNRSEFAEKLHVTPGRVTQLLDGDANMTLATVARALHVFGHVLEATSRPLDNLYVETVWRVHAAPEGWHEMNQCHTTIRGENRTLAAALGGGSTRPLGMVG